MIIDSHVHLGPTLDNAAWVEQDATSGASVIKILDRNGIDKAIVFAPIYESGPWNDPNFHIANFAVAEACHAYPDRLIGYGRVNPNLGTAAVEEFRHCVEDYKLKGLMLHPDTEGFSPANKRVMWPLAEICAEHGFPISFHAGYYPRCHPMIFVPLVEAFPTVPIYLKHTCYEYWPDAIIVAQRYPNIYLETSGSSTLSEISTVIRELGAHRLCYGSDTPYQLPQVVMKKITSQPISDEDKELVLWRNTARINKLSV